METFSTGLKWIEVDLSAVKNNLGEIRKKVGPHVKIMGVVKADAYGLGALETSRVLAANEADMLAVTTVEEGLELRGGGISCPILVLGPFLPQEAFDMAKAKLTATVASLEQITWLAEASALSKEKIAVHLKIETGMGRLGFIPEQAAEAAKRINALPGLALEGIYTHLATAMWKKQKYVRQQCGMFQNAVHNLETAGITGLIRHIASSAALISLPDLHLDMVRAGTLLYGQPPLSGITGGMALRDPWTFKTRVVYLKELPPGHGVGYGRTYVTKRRTRVAVIPAGFFDGLSVEPVFRPVNLAETGKGIVKIVLQYLGHPRMAIPVLFAGGTGRVIGKVGMQLSMVDVTGIDGVEVGSEAILPVRRTVAGKTIPRIYTAEKGSAY